MSSFTDIQAGLYCGKRSIPEFVEYLSISDETHEKNTRFLNEFNHHMLVEKMPYINMTDEQKEIVKQVIMAFQNDCQYPDKPGFISSGVKLDRYLCTDQGLKIYYSILNKYPICKHRTFIKK